MIVPTKILICVTPEEKILGNNFLKNIFILLLFLNLKEIFGIKYFLTKKIKKINCISPAKVTAYER